MHQIQFSAGDRPQTPLGGLTTLARPPSWIWRKGKGKEKRRERRKGARERER